MNQSGSTLSPWYLSRPIAHRGLCDDNKNLIENSMSAFRQCVAKGRPIELDVHLMADDSVVVFHDETLERMTGVRGEIADMNCQNLRSLQLLASGEKIPLLAEVLEEIAGRVPLLIELKTKKFNGALENRVAKLLELYKGEFALQSFHPRSVHWLRSRWPAIKCGLLSYDYSDSALPGYQNMLLKHAPFLPLLSPDFVALEWKHLQSPLASLARLLNFPLLAWTVRTNDALNKCQNQCHNIIYEFPVVPENFCPVISQSH